MSSSQNASDTSASNDYQAQLDQLLQEVQIGLDRLDHNVIHFNDDLQILAAVGDHFAGPFHLWKSLHMSIKISTSGEMKCDEDDKNVDDTDSLDFEKNMLEEDPVEDEKREDRQHRFVHSTMNETVVLDTSSFDEN